MRKTLGGSKSVRGRKKRRNIRKSMARKEKTLPQTMRRRSLLTGGSGALCTSGPAGGLAATAFVTPLLTAGVGVEVAFDAPVAGTARAAAGVVEGTSLLGASPVGGASATVPEDARLAEGGTAVLSFTRFSLAGFGSGRTTSPRAAASRSSTEGFPPSSFSPTPGLLPSPVAPDALSAGGAGVSLCSPPPNPLRRPQDI